MPNVTQYIRLIEFLVNNGSLRVHSSRKNTLVLDKIKLKAALELGNFTRSPHLSAFTKNANKYGFKCNNGSRTLFLTHSSLEGVVTTTDLRRVILSLEILGSRKPNKGNNKTRALKRQAQALQAVPKKRTRDETLMPNKKPRTSGQKFCIDSVLWNIESNVEDGTGFIRFNTDVIPVTTSNCDDTLANNSPEQDSIPGQTNGRECEVKPELDAVFDEYSSSTNTHDGVVMMIDALNTLIENQQKQMVKYGFDEHVHLERGVRYGLKTPMAPSRNFPQMYADYNKAY